METETYFSQLFPSDTSDMNVLEYAPVVEEMKELKKVRSKILIMESDPLAGMFIKALLDKYSIPFVFVTNESDAKNEIRKQPFNILVIGVNNPEIPCGVCNAMETIITQRHTIGIMCLHTKNHLADENFNHILIHPYRAKDLIQVILECENEVERGVPSAERQPSFDLEQLKKISNNNEEFISKMLDKFALTAIECSEALREGLNVFDISKIQKAAHKAIPSYSVMGLPQLVEYLEALETYDATAIGNIREIVSNFLSKNDMVINDIRDYQKK